MEPETSKKKYESGHRLRWAARYPLKPGRDVASRRGLLLLIADTAIHRRVLGVSSEAGRAAGAERSSQSKRYWRSCAPRELLRAQHRGFKQTNIYTLMRLGEVAQHGDFLPLEATRTALADRTVHVLSTTSPPI